ncbi:hypothetical protein V5799_030381 [Amblyomma americanum]|uniref:Uncharacterized protein n=1 Tax=Amblyomma americanum TaxID=6943 RepID=A0AAQ4EP48_AMBAM
MPSTLSSTASALIQKMLHAEKNRPSIEDILQDDFMTYKTMVTAISNHPDKEPQPVQNPTRQQRHQPQTPSQAKKYETVIS